MKSLSVWGTGYSNTYVVIKSIWFIMKTETKNKLEKVFEKGSIVCVILLLSTLFSIIPVSIYGHCVCDYDFEQKIGTYYESAYHASDVPTMLEYVNKTINETNKYLDENDTTTIILHRYEKTVGYQLKRLIGIRERLIELNIRFNTENTNITLTELFYLKFNDIKKEMEAGENLDDMSIKHELLDAFNIKYHYTWATAWLVYLILPVTLLVLTIVLWALKQMCW